MTLSHDWNTLHSQRTNLIEHHLKCYFNNFEMLEPKSIKIKIKKRFSIISSHNCLSRLRSQTLAIRKQDNMKMFVIAFCPVQVIYYLEKNSQCFPGCSNFIFYWYIAPVTQKGTFTFTFTFNHLADAFIQSDVQMRRTIEAIRPSREQQYKCLDKSQLV